MPDSTAKLLQIWRAAQRSSEAASRVADAALAAAEAAEAAAVAARHAAIEAGLSVDAADEVEGTAQQAYDARQREVFRTVSETPDTTGAASDVSPRPEPPSEPQEQSAPH